MQKIFSFKDPGPERCWIGIEAPSLDHEDSLVSMAGGGYSQPFGLFGKCDCFRVNRVASPVVVSITLEEVIAQFIYVVADLLREKRGCMAYIGTEVTEALMRMARPTIERYLACHPSIRLRILSTRY